MGTKFIKGLANFLKLSGGTMTGNIDMGDNDITEVKSLAYQDGGAVITEVTNDDSLGTSDTKLCTQGNVKAYVDSELSSHSGDSTDPHGATLTNTNIILTGDLKLPVASSAPLDTPTEGTIRIVDLGSGRSQYYFYVYINGGWRSEVLT